MGLDLAERQRALAVLEECLERFQLLHAVKPDMKSHKVSIQSQAEREINKIIDQQTNLENQYHKLLQERIHLHNSNANKNKIKETQHKISDIAIRLRNSTQSLMHNLQGNPNITENVTKIQNERLMLQNLLTKSMREIREGSFESLMRAVLEETARCDTRLEVFHKQATESSQTKELQTELAALKEQRVRDVEERDAKITQLKEELQALKSDSRLKIEYLKKETNARTQSIERVHEQSTGQLENQLWTLGKKLEIEERANQESEEFLRRKTSHLQGEIQMWMDKYEADTEEADRKLEALKSKRVDDLAKLNDYSKRYNKEMAEIARLEQEEHERVIKERARREEHTRFSMAALTVQSMWRGYLARTGGAGGGGKKKKGGKGKKKKK